MNRIPRPAIAAGVVILLIGVAILAIGRGQSVGVQGTPAPSPTPAMAIADGTYAVDLPVDDILVALAANPALNAQEKNAVIDDILGIRGAEVLNLEIFVDHGEFFVRQGADGTPKSVNAPWTMKAVNDHTVGFTNVPSVGSATYEVVPGPTAGSFTLHPTTPAGSAVEEFVRGVLFETAPYVPVP